MLPFNRIYTPQELQAMSRLTPAHPRPLASHAPAHRPAPTGRGGLLVALRQRLFARGGLRRSAPSAT